MRKRRIALLRSLGKTNEAVTALVELLDYSPTDAEAWSELADLYLLQGLYPQAIYSLEEVLLVTPNAWNVGTQPGNLRLEMLIEIDPRTTWRSVAHRSFYIYWRWYQRPDKIYETILSQH